MNGPTIVAAGTRRARIETGAVTGIELHVGQPAGELVRDFVAGDARLAPFYAGHHRDLSPYRAKADEVRRRLSAADRQRLRAAYRPTNARVEAKLDRVLAGDGVAVTTGQQAGLFGGPPYTIYKILSTIRLAESLEERLGQPVVAVFWIGSHDHDWVEVNHAHVVDSANVVRRIEVEGDAEPQVAMSERIIGAPIASALDAVISALPQTEFAAPLIELLRGTYRPDATMAGAFGDLLHNLLADFDVVLFDPAHPIAKAAAGPLIAHELESSAAHAALLDAQSRRLVRAGYHAQVTIAAEAANVFLHDDAGRDRLVRENGGWFLRRTKRLLTVEEVRALVAAEPGHFSPNVLLRPVVESALIPTIAYVGGPAEISYFAQIGCLFGAHGIEAPLAVPRQSVMIVEAKVRKVLNKFGLEPTDFARPFHELSTQVIHGELPESVTGPLERLKPFLDSNYQELVEGAASIDPTLRGWLAGNRSNVLNQLEAAEKKITSHLKKRSEVELEQLAKAAVNLYPEGTHQERVLSLLPLIARYGPGLLADLASIMEPEFDGSFDGWNGVECTGAG
jgi:bacillithiol biosynthesis cysteine-adding enzyme BshC